MTISVRLDRKTEALLERLSQTGNRSKSDVIRESIAEMARRKSDTSGRLDETLYDRIRPFIGRIESDGSLLQGDFRGRLKERMRKRNFSERSR